MVLVLLFQSYLDSRVVDVEKYDSLDGGVRESYCRRMYVIGATLKRFYGDLLKYILL